MNHSVCKTDNTLEFHPTSPIPVGYRAEISVIKVIEEFKCHFFQIKKGCCINHLCSLMQQPAVFCYSVFSQTPRNFGVFRQPPVPDPKKLWVNPKKL